VSPIGVNRFGFEGLNVVDPLCVRPLRRTRLGESGDLQGLLDATAATIDDSGGRIEVTYTTHLITAEAV
jgi:hypothetical protein